MKKIKYHIYKYGLLILTFFTIFYSCDKDNSLVEEDNPINNNADPNKVTASLIFDNMNIVNGDLPKSTNTKIKNTVDLKIDSDSIFWTPGIIKRIKIKKPIGTVMTGVWIYIPGADDYIEADFREDEDNEDVGVLYFDFNPTDWDLPVSFPMKIIPLDDTGNPVGDEFEQPVVIEEPITGNSDWKVNNTQRWFWQYTKDKTYDLFHAPYKKIKTPGTTLGCCIGGQSEPNGFCGGSDKRVLDYENQSITRSMFFTLYENGNVLGFEKSEYRNVSIFDSDFCGNYAAYTYTHGQGLIFKLPLELKGKHNISNGILTIKDVTLNETAIGAGSQVEFTLLSDHILEERLKSSPDLPDGLGSAKKIWEKTYYLIDDEGERWHD